MGAEVESDTALSLWSIDAAHSSIQFKVRHMAISWVRGEFQSVTGSLGLDGDDITRSRFAVDIDSASVHTGDVERDRHLRSADFLTRRTILCAFSIRSDYHDGRKLLSRVG